VTVTWLPVLLVSLNAKSGAWLTKVPLVNWLVFWPAAWSARATAEM
jgi:hypothetical protein